MPTLKYDPYTNSFGLEPSEEDWKWLAKAFGLGHRDAYLDYSPDRAAEAYQDSCIPFVQTPDGNARTPYQILFDYRSSPVPHGWGGVSFEGEYRFPDALSRHKTAMVASFGDHGLLSKGNQAAPRVIRFESGNGVPRFVLEGAHYYDQVGSNLSLDYPFSEPVTVRDCECRCVRDWDVAQAHGTAKLLPRFEESKLANTIGVAIGITARSRDGHVHWLRRKRLQTVAVFPGMWHVPFSFALAIDNQSRMLTDLRSLIRFDFGHEQAEELGGLDYSDFGELRPIAFCRDLARGGKPQFFFELPSRVPFEQLRRRAKDTTSEFSGKIEVVSEGEKAERYSPELSCFLLLTSDPDRQKAK